MKKYLLKSGHGVYIVHETTKDLNKYITAGTKISFGKEFYSVVQEL